MTSRVQQEQLLLCLLLFTHIHAQNTPGLNGVIGTPKVECGDTQITVTLQTESPFLGNLYAKGFFHKKECRVKGWLKRSKSIEISVHVDDECGTRRTRVVSPRGIILEITVVMMFHRLFLTKIDKSYHVECFYTQYDHAVSQSYDVSIMIPTDIPSGDLNQQSSESGGTALQGAGSSRPSCKYEVLAGGPTGKPVKYARIGDVVFHKWTCTVGDGSSKSPLFCMTVHSCLVDDGHGDGQQLLDESGCTRDSFIIENLEYPTPMSAMHMIQGQTASVFRFADTPTVFFSCQIRLERRTPNEQCKSIADRCNIMKSPTIAAQDYDEDRRIDVPVRFVPLVEPSFPLPPSDLPLGGDHVENEIADLSALSNLPNGVPFVFNMPKSSSASASSISMNVASLPGNPPPLPGSSMSNMEHTKTAKTNDRVNSGALQEVDGEDEEKDDESGEAEDDENDGVEVEEDDVEEVSPVRTTRQPPTISRTMPTTTSSSWTTPISNMPLDTGTRYHPSQRRVPQHRAAHVPREHDVADDQRRTGRDGGKRDVDLVVGWPQDESAGYSSEIPTVFFEKATESRPRAGGYVDPNAPPVRLLRSGTTAAGEMDADAGVLEFSRGARKARASQRYRRHARAQDTDKDNKEEEGFDVDVSAAAVEVADLPLPDEQQRYFGGSDLMPDGVVCVSRLSIFLSIAAALLTSCVTAAAAWLLRLRYEEDGVGFGFSSEGRRFARRGAITKPFVCKH